MFVFVKKNKRDGGPERKKGPRPTDRIGRARPTNATREGDELFTDHEDQRRRTPARPRMANTSTEDSRSATPHGRQPKSGIRPRKSARIDRYNLRPAFQHTVHPWLRHSNRAMLHIPCHQQDTRESMYIAAWAERAQRPGAGSHLRINCVSNPFHTRMRTPSANGADHTICRPAGSALTKGPDIATTGLSSLMWGIRKSWSRRPSAAPRGLWRRIIYMFGTGWAVKRAIKSGRRPLLTTHVQDPS